MYVSINCRKTSRERETEGKNNPLDANARSRQPPVELDPKQAKSRWVEMAMSNSGQRKTRLTHRKPSKNSARERRLINCYLKCLFNEAVKLFICVLKFGPKIIIMSSTDSRAKTKMMMK